MYANSTKVIGCPPTTHPHTVRNLLFVFFIGVNTGSTLVLNNEDYAKTACSESGSTLPAFSRLGATYHRPNNHHHRVNPYSMSAVPTTTNYATDWQYHTDATGGLQYNLMNMTSNARSRPPGSTPSAAASLTASK